MPVITRRRAARAAAIAMVASGTVATFGAAANAAAWEPNAQFVGIADSSLAGSGCTASNQVTNSAAPIDLTADVAKSTSANAAITATDNTDSTDTLTTSAHISATGEILASGASATGMNIKWSGGQSSTASQGTSTCSATADAFTGIQGVFSVAKPTVVTIDSWSAGDAAFEMGISPGSTGPGFGQPGSFINLNLTQSPRDHSTFYLPAGTYSVIAEGVVAPEPVDKTRTRSAAGQIHMSFAPAGSRVARSGSSTYVKLPASQICSTNQVDAKITGIAKNAKRIKTATFLVSGHLARRLTAPHAGTVAKLSTAAHASDTVTVTARVKLRDGKTVTSTATYLQCS